jgi:hypothetical protein
MSNNFAERFKGRIEAFSKEGVGKITVPSGNPVNAIREYQPQPSMDGAERDPSRFSRNAQANILDFQKRYQPMLQSEQDAPLYYETDPGFNHPYRGVYSAFDPSRNPHPQYARMTDGYLHPYPSQPPLRSHTPADSFGKRSSLIVAGTGHRHVPGAIESVRNQREMNLKSSNQPRAVQGVRGTSEKVARTVDAAKENFNFGGLGPNYNKFWVDK